jgi:glutathione synthase/RimK-type ligase-like ATP-grasp enzyme
MHYHPQVRMLHKRCMAILAMNPDLRLIPDYRSSIVYDDKAEQARQFARWMPRTRIFYTPNAARNFLQHMKFPFVSKSSEGSSSANVRFVQTQEEARQEIKMAFSDIGIKCRYGQTQRGYLLWQDFISDNTGDVRVLGIGNLRLMVQRRNRGDMPVANGNEITPINALTSSDLEHAFQTANEFFKAEKMPWAGVDMVRDHDTGKWYILETTVGWTMHSYAECKFLDMSGEATSRKGDDIWNVLISQIENGVYGNV